MFYRKEVLIGILLKLAVAVNDNLCKLEKQSKAFAKLDFIVRFEWSEMWSVFHKGSPEHSKNSRSRKFSWELGPFFLARPWEISLHISFPSRNMRLWKKISRARLEPWDVERKNLALVSKTEIFIQISREKKTYNFKKFWENNSLFLKIYVIKQAINVIPKNSRENCLEHEIERKEFSFPSREFK